MEIDGTTLALLRETAEALGLPTVVAAIDEAVKDHHGIDTDPVTVYLQTGPFTVARTAVQSETSDGTWYSVTTVNGFPVACTCADFLHRKSKQAPWHGAGYVGSCKHMRTV